MSNKQKLKTARVLSKSYSHISSQMTIVITLYFAFALDLVTTFCFVLLHDIKLQPTKTQYPKVERLSLGDPIQLS